MTILQKLRGPDYESAMAAQEFCKLARVLVQANGRLSEAVEWARSTNAKPRIHEILQKAAVSAGGTDSWSAISPYAEVSLAFTQSLRNVGVFDRMLPDMAPCPMKSRGATIVTGVSGSSPSERTAKPVSTISFGSSVAEPKKAAGIVVISEEIAKFASPGASELFDRELRNAVSFATDQQFLADLLAATTPAGSSGSTLANVMSDLDTLLAAVGTNANSKLYFIAAPLNIKGLALKAGASGSPAFVNLGPSGGEILPGLVAIASDALSAPGVAILADATGIAAASDIVTLDATRQAVLSLESAPDSPPLASTTVTSLWQHNLQGLRAERFFAYTLLRSNAVASLSGVNY